MKDDKIRLQKYLSECGFASRRHAEDLISMGKVKINGRKAKLGDKVGYYDHITVQGKPVPKKSGDRVYIMLNKPRGYITTLKDEFGRKCIIDLLEGVKERVYPVGRLDRDSEGLLLLSNDGAFTNAMMHPTHHIPKTYRVTVRPGPTDQQVKQMMEGLVIDGRKTAPCEVRTLSAEENRVVLEIQLFEGRNRQIRKMCEQLGLTVARLKRTAIGGLKLGMLPVGKWRELSDNEVRSLSSLSKRKTEKIN